METIEQNLKQILSDKSLDAAREELHAAFHLLDVLAFTRRLRGIQIPDSTKSALVALKARMLAQPAQPKVDPLEVVLQASLNGFWNRLADDAAREKR
jgi:hypothetical protein